MRATDKSLFLKRRCIPDLSRESNRTHIDAFGITGFLIYDWRSVQHDTLTNKKGVASTTQAKPLQK